MKLMKVLELLQRNQCGLSDSLCEIWFFLEMHAILVVVVACLSSERISVTDGDSANST